MSSLAFDRPAFWISILQIIWIDILLSGDNAVVIALACRSLPPHQRRKGMVLGAGTAVGLRILFAFLIATLLELPYLKLVGGILLLWIAVKLIKGEDDAEHDVGDSHTLWRAVRTIAVADAVMSLDNVVAIAAASHGNSWLFVLGLLLSVPLIVTGSALIMTLISKFPLLVWAGGALLGWIAGEMIVSDPALKAFVAGWTDFVLHRLVPALAAVLVLLAGWFWARRDQAQGADRTLRSNAERPVRRRDHA